MARRFRGFRLRTKLGLFAATATAAVLGVTAHLSGQFVESQMLAVTSAESSTESEALRVVLEEQMKAGDRKLLNRLVSDIGKASGISWVAVLDDRGVVRISSDERALGETFLKTSPDCLICHEHKATDRQRSVTLVHPGGTVLRTVTPLMNSTPCHECHGPVARINGVLIVDRSLSGLNAAATASRTYLLLGGFAALCALLLSLGLAVEHFVLGRLRRLAHATRELGRGNFDGQASDTEQDELGDLGRDFHAMAERLATAMEWCAAERKKLDELVNGIGDGLVLIDTNLMIVTTNHAFAGRLPPSFDLRTGEPYRDLAQAAGLDIKTAVTTPAERALISGQLEKEIFRISRDNKEHVEEIYAQPLRQPDGRVTAVIEVWRDITDRLLLEAGLEQSERLAALGILASSVAHEVGNPLASIATAVEGLLRRLDDPSETATAELREYLEIVRKQVFRCHGVTQRLLGFARVPSRGPGRVDAAAAAREVLALVGPQARAQKVRIESALEVAVPVAAEDMLLEQVFLNLVLNALRAMPTGGLLKVVAQSQGERVFVTFADNGPGIPDAIRQRLFEPLLSSRANGVGTGLGLFLSQALVRRCGGSITLDSHEGVGTVFTVGLRAAPDNALPQGSPV